MSQDELIRHGATPKQIQARARLRYEEWRETFKAYEPPERAELEKLVEDATRCKKCSGPVRSLMEQAQPGQSFATDIEILFMVECRDAACAWQERQWRGWNRAAPRTI